MQTGHAIFGDTVSEDQAELDEMRGWAVRRITGIAIAIALLLLARASLGPEMESWEAFVGGLALGGVGLLSYRLSRWGVEQASTCLVLGLLVVIAVASAASGDSDLPALFGPTVVVVGIVCGWRQAFVAAVAGSAVTLVSVPRPEPLPAGAPLLPLTVIWLSAILAWVTLTPLRTALTWAWANYTDAQLKTAQLRQRQQELIQALRDLDIAYSRLREANAELARARRVAEEARLAKVEFATTLSHELRTPLNLVIGFSELMLQASHDYYGERLPAAYASDVEAIYRNATHIRSLVDDVLDLARVEAHRMPLRLQRTSLVQIVEEATNAIWGLLQHKRLNLVVEIPPDLPSVWADPSRVRQILINLLNNAARCTDEGGVCVRAELVGGDVVTSVADTGVGIAPEELPGIFDEFRQTGDPLLQHGGSGLGLAICKSFVEMLGGSIWVESQVGVGSTFHFSLPTCDNVVSMLPERDLDRLVPADAPHSAGKTLVVVDSDPEVVALLQRYLWAYRVVADGAEPSFSGTADSTKPAAFVATGEPEACHPDDLVRGLSEDQLVVLCPLSTPARALKRLGVADYLAKPVTSARLEAALQRWARGSGYVLVVDDEPEMVQLIVRMILADRPDRRAIGAFSGAEALSRMREERPDRVLLDLLMPGLSGYDVLSAMQQEEALRDVPVAVMSAKGQPEEAIKASMLGIIRPGGFTVGEAVALMETMLGVLLDATGNAASTETAASGGGADRLRSRGVGICRGAASSSLACTGAPAPQ